MNHLLSLILMLTGANLLSAQEPSPSITDLQNRYPAFKEKTISTKRFEVEDMVPVFKRFNANSHISFSVQANSLENRPIYLAQYGDGSIPVLFWSQMHGNESTATMALLDVFNYLESDNPADQAFLASIRKHLTLYFIPMLNPDGASRFQRRNAANIDLNRDAMDLSNPESRFLKKIRDSLSPVFGFNLHDQSIYYRAGNEGNQVALSFLAPAFDYPKNINGVRLRAMQLIAELRDTLDTLIPDRIAVYDDSFEPRAFGDNIQRWGTSTILIESGGYPDDPEKQYLRQLNFITIIKALESILTGTYNTKSISDYQTIPENDHKMMSLIIQDLQVPVENNMISMDIGYLYGEESNEGHTIYPASISDVGDLSIYNGFHVFPAKEFKAIPGKWYPTSFENLKALASIDWPSLVQEGYLGFVVDDIQVNASSIPPYLTFKKPQDKDNRLELKIAPGKNPTFIMQNMKSNQRWIVHNGTVLAMDEFIDHIKESFLNNN